MKLRKAGRRAVATKYIAVGIVILALAVIVGYAVVSSSSTSSTTTSTAASTTSSTAQAPPSTSTSTTSSSSTTQSTSTSSSSSTSAPTIPDITPPATPPTSNSASAVTIGYFANLNHAPAVLGLNNGDFQKFLGNSTTIQTTLFTSGSPEMTALLAGKIQVAYVGPDPAVNAYITSSGSALQVVSGVANGGAVFVVTNASGITSVKDLGGKTFAAPGVGNTQDVALRHFLQVNGYNTTTEGGNVTVQDTANANILTLMEKGQIDGAWVPEPWGAEIVADSASHIFVNEQSLWPNGFSTTELVVAKSFLQAHPDIVKEIVEANLYETYWIQNNPQQADVDLSNELGNLTGAPISLSIIQNAMTRLSFTDSPLEPSVLQQAENAYGLGDLGTVAPTASSIGGIYNLTILDSILASYNIQPISSAPNAAAGAAASALPSVADGVAVPAPALKPAEL